jgi:hypothetical protein
MENVKSAPINYPCVMFEKKDTIGISLTEKDLMKKFALINNVDEYFTKKASFENPVICHYYSVINEALRINKML